MRKTIILFLVITLIFLYFCNNKGTNPVIQKRENGIIHVYNDTRSAEGNVTLEVKEILRIDSLSIDEENPPGLNIFARDRKNNIYLCDSRTPRMYRFSPDVRLLNEFLTKGEGPGEFPMGVYSFQIVNDMLWLSHSRKLASFTLEGNLINEWKFDRNITFTEMVDGEKLIGNIYENDLTDQRERVCAVFDRKGNTLNRLFEDKDAGFSEIQLRSNGNTRIIRFFSALITNDILHTYDRDREQVYLFLSNQYIIYRKNIQGKTELVVHKKHQQVRLSEEDRMNIISQTFARMPPDRREMVKDVLPGRFVAINRIDLLPGGHIAVRRVAGFRKYVYDIFDSSGCFILTLKPPPEIPGFFRAQFLENMLWVVKEIEERDVFILYRVENLPESLFRIL